MDSENLIDFMLLCLTKKASPVGEAFYWVEDNGVEPMTSCMPCKRSSQLS